MFKRLFLTLATIAGLLSPAFAAGTIPFSLSQQLDQYGKVLNGCYLYTIRAGTTSTPQNAYQDAALTIPVPNPIRCDAAGRLPQFFLADGQIKVRLTDKNGVSQVVADNIQVVGASTGGGGGGTVDPTTLAQTGDTKYRYGVGTLSGWVRMNGRTIGSATSGATERANADAQQLFEYLWGADGALAVSGGRGASANADWTANKTIEVPDLRARTMAGMADMGNTAATTLNGVLFQRGSPTTFGSYLGVARTTLTASKIPALPVSVTVTGTASVSSTVAGIPSGMLANAITLTGAGDRVPYWPGGAILGAISSTGSITGTGTGTASPTGGDPFDNVSPFLLVTAYIKL